jgi:hypothetical protein
MTGGNGLDQERFAIVTRRRIAVQLYKLRKTDILVFLFIATYADGDTGKNAFPGIDTIAAGVHCSREHVSHATARLACWQRISARTPEAGGRPSATRSSAWLLQRATTWLLQRATNGCPTEQLTRTYTRP